MCSNAWRCPHLVLHGVSPTAGSPLNKCNTRMSNAVAHNDEPLSASTSPRPVGGRHPYAHDCHTPLLVSTGLAIATLLKQFGSLPPSQSSIHGSPFHARPVSLVPPGFLHPPRGPGARGRRMNQRVEKIHPESSPLLVRSYRAECIGPGGWPKLPYAAVPSTRI